jgi:hypothetical protein
VITPDLRSGEDTDDAIDETDVVSLTACSSRYWRSAHIEEARVVRR